MGRPPLERTLPLARGRTRGQRTLTTLAPPRSGILRPLYDRLGPPLGSGGNLILILDFDGTLTPIVSRPDAARLDPTVRRTLRRLAANPRVGLAVLTGRSLRDIRQRIGIKNIVYGGCHGLEIEGPALRITDRKTGQVHPRLENAAKMIESSLARFPGACVERKRYSVALHYRHLARTRVGALSRVVHRAARAHNLGIIPGKKVWEFVRPGFRGKSEAVRAARFRLKKRREGRSGLVMYIGDDASDTRISRFLGEEGIAVQVGGRRGSADFRLRGVPEVHALLRWIAEAAAATRSGGRGARGSLSDGG
jgi:trehalose-phosphatase